MTRTPGAAASSINHFGRLRSATISASPVGVPLGTVIAETEDMLRQELPPGFLFTWGSEARDLNEANRDVWWILALAAIIIYMTLAAQFESLVHPFTVMLAVPLAGVGAFGLLWLLDFLGKSGVISPIPAMNFNLFSQVGLVLLIGLVTKNSILLVEYANQQIAKGMDSHGAMIEAGAVRLRPILMTAFSTMAGILPIAIGFGAGAESRRPMGVAVVGGMMTSTFLTLFVIPVVYTLLSDLTRQRRNPAAMCASMTRSMPRCSAAAGRKARCFTCVSPPSPWPCSKPTATCHCRPTSRTPTRPKTKAAIRPCSPPGPAPLQRRPQHFISTRRCWREWPSAASPPPA